MRARLAPTPMLVMPSPADSSRATRCRPDRIHVHGSKQASLPAHPTALGGISSPSRGIVPVAIARSMRASMLAWACLRSRSAFSRDSASTTAFIASEQTPLARTAFRLETLALTALNDACTRHNAADAGR